MTTTIKPEIRDLWADALESGEYEQTGDVLVRIAYDCDDNPIPVGFCCLGVLCDLAVKAGVIPEPIPSWEEVGDNDSAILCLRFGRQNPSGTVLPPEVIEWAGLGVEDPTLTAADGTRHSAAAWNDSYAVDFSQIAEMVRALPAPEEG